MSAVRRIPQNDYIAHQVEKVATAVPALAAQGFTVLSVHIAERNPVIWVQRSPRCERLKGAWRVLRAVGQGREAVMAAPYEGCQVQWLERGA